MSRPVVLGSLAFLALGVVSAQKAPEPWSKEHREKVAREYGISDLKLPYKDAGEPPFSTAQPVADWLKQRFKAHIYPSLTRGSVLKEFTGEFSNTSVEDEVKVIVSGVNFIISVADTIEGGGNTTSNFLARSQVNYEKGSFSGSPVGDWTARRFDRGAGASLVFFRKNAFVFLSCGEAIEVAKADKSRRVILPDASLRQKCEDLARDIDAELVNLPVAAKEVK
ncbi:MAG TPA: hypothetical protein PLZ95_04410 [Bryobacteraceae bacterium]|nr:hypothetical protein [Bryobacteraceae bacterium]